MALITLGANSGKGKVLQVVSSGEATLATINSTSYVLSISLAITPTSASNKIFVTFDGQYQQDDVNNASTATKLRIRY